VEELLAWLAQADEQQSQEQRQRAALQAVLEERRDEVQQPEERLLEVHRASRQRQLEQAQKEQQAAQELALPTEVPLQEEPRGAPALPLRPWLWLLFQLPPRLPGPPVAGNASARARRGQDRVNLSASSFR